MSDQQESVRRRDRKELEIPLRVWGVDRRGERFTQEARAREVSLSGALLSQLEAELRSGDIIGILYCGRKARYRVVWARYSDAERKFQAAVQRIDADPCPWQDLLSEKQGVCPVSVGISEF